MSELSGNNPEAVQRMQASLHELAEVLREPQRLDPQAQKAIANLVDEFGRLLTTTNLPSPQTAQLADSAAQLVKSLQRKEHPSLLTAAKKRLEAATLRAETEAPTATGLAWRLLETLANLGI
jgi:hypothetical protein